MPSARELLEQADALMRRNRSPLMDDIPVLTDSVPEVVRRRETSRAQAQEAGAIDPDTIPMLTESVAGVADETESAVEPRPAVVDEGDASTWLRTGGAEPSVIGDAPDSIARVPAFADEETEEIVVEAPIDVEEAFDEELALRDTSELASSVDEAAPNAGEDLAAQGAARKAAEEAAAQDATRRAEADARRAAEEAAAQEVARRAADEAAAQEVARRAAQAAALEDATRKSEEAARRAQEDVRQAEEESARRASHEAARKAAEEARWASMAEEIRMQVLQRIDLFTDTGLRDQLATRLQPIVDRASADLVATINQHVGDLLRTYVAEAIEREIENWKSNSRNP